MANSIPLNNPFGTPLNPNNIGMSLQGGQIQQLQQTGSPTAGVVQPQIQQTAPASTFVGPVKPNIQIAPGQQVQTQNIQLPKPKYGSQELLDKVDQAQQRGASSTDILNALVNSKTRDVADFANDVSMAHQRGANDDQILNAIIAKKSGLAEQVKIKDQAEEKQKMIDNASPMQQIAAAWRQQSGLDPVPPSSLTDRVLESAVTAGKQFGSTVFDAGKSLLYDLPKNATKNLLIEPITQGINTIQATPSMLKTLYDAGKYGIDSPQVSGGLAETNTYLNAPKELYGSTIQPTSSLEPSQQFGRALETASYLPGGKLAEGLASGPIANTVPAFFAGAFGSGGNYLEQGGQDPTEFLKQAGQGGLQTAMFGKAMEAASPIMTRPVSENIPHPIEAFDKARMGEQAYTEMQAKKLKNTIKEVIEPAIPKRLRDKQGDFRDYKEELLQNPHYLENIKVKDKKFNTEAAQDAVTQDRNIIGQLIDQNSKNIPGFANLEDFRIKALANLNKDTTLSAKGKLEAAKTIKSEIDALQAEHGNNPRFDVINNEKSTYDNRVNYNTPNPDVITNNTYHILRQTAEQYVGENLPSKNLKELNTKYGSLSNLQNVLESLNGKPTKGGKLGGYAARTIGGIAGATHGPVGTILGALGADTIHNIIVDANIPLSIREGVYRRALSEINPTDVQLKKFLDQTWKDATIKAPMLPPPPPGNPPQGSFVTPTVFGTQNASQYSSPDLGNLIETQSGQNAPGAAIRRLKQKYKRP